MAERPIAVIGMSGRFPQSDGLDIFWRNLVEGRDCIGEILTERWHLPSLVGEAATGPGTTYCRQAGMDAEADCYDASFFRLDAEEARRMDPQQGMALELAWHACEDAGVVPDSLIGQEVGVFVGVSTRDYDRRMADRWQHIDVRTSTGASGAIVANRISYLFGLTGPSVAVDGACASSLASVHLACRALADGECNLALAGGIQVILSPANMIAFSQGGLLARDGRCKPFSAKADGFVCGEGGGMVLLKSLDHATEDGYRIRAVIRGSAMNHNGRSNGMSAPYRKGQAQVIRKALERSAVPASSIDYVETHTAGTLLGDAIEVQAIQDVYGDQRSATRPCFVGSVKSNIGHLEAAAGIAAFLKAALTVERGILPPSLHCQPPSDLLRLDKGAIKLCDGVRPWPDSDGPRRAGVSAFSFGGGNTHLIVEQASECEAVSSSASGPWLLVISAASSAAFAKLAAAYATQLESMRAIGAPLSLLRDVCVSSLAHRQLHVLCRAYVVRNWGEAIAALREATPVAVTAGQFRIAVEQPLRFGEETTNWPELETTLADVPAASLGALRLIALLKHFGVDHLDIEGSSSTLTACSEFAARSGIATAQPGVGARRTHSLVLVDDTTSTDFLWQSEQRAVELCMTLAGALLQRGFPFRWRSFATLAGSSTYVPLPLYPFDRRRNHVLHDEIEPARHGAEIAVHPLVASAR
jgi:acyl transferase domain-containing protein